jgi:hypothetical protein
MIALWSAGPWPRFWGVKAFAKTLVGAVCFQSQKRRQAAALQNVGMPTIKVLLEVQCWNGSSGFTPLPRRDKPAATEVGA